MSPAADPQPEQPGLEHPTNGIDETVHQRHRLGILTITAEAQRAEFGYLREALGLTPGNLSKHLTVLEQAGMVEVEKGYAGRRPGPGYASPPRAARRSPPNSPRSPNSSAGTQRAAAPDKQSSPDGTLRNGRADPEHRTQNNHPVHLHQFACRSQPA